MNRSVRAIDELIAAFPVADRNIGPVTRAVARSAIAKTWPNNSPRKCRSVTGALRHNGFAPAPTCSPSIGLCYYSDSSDTQRTPPRFPGFPSGVGDHTITVDLRRPAISEVSTVSDDFRR